MKITKENLNLEQGLDREWIITNGIGGYSASSIIGANNRKYHGLLIAALTPPARRFLILSKVDESLEIRGRKYNLYTNVGKEFISKGYEYQETFEKDYIPIFTYKIGKVEITKKICMEYGKNLVGIYYKIKNGASKAKLTLAPIMNFRDFHTVNTNHQYELKQEYKDRKAKIVIDGHSETPIYMITSEGKYIPHQNDSFKKMFYLEEEKRGFCGEEDHVIPGRYEIEIKAKEEKEISFICSLEENIEEKNVKNLIRNEVQRLDKIIENTDLIENKNKKTKKELQKDELIKNFVIATDNFVVNRPNFGLHTLIAGYPWFLDWGRDTCIAFEGIVLLTKRYDIAKEIIKTMTRDVKYGLVPNGYSGYDNRPLYNSVDASLLLFEAVNKYLKYTGDYQFIKEEIYPVLENVIESYCKGIDVSENNIYLDIDGLIVSGTENTQNTWMDVKFAGKAVTPRNGKAVEVNSLWYNANKIMEKLSIKFGHLISAKRYKELAKQCKKAFEEKFYNQENKCLYDVLGDSKIRPNQLFALSLTYPVLEPNSEKAKNIIKIVEKKLLNSYGLKTLAKGEPNYVEIYEGNEEHRDTSYHQGITWTWLLGLYYNALKNQLNATKDKDEKNELETKIEKFANKTEKTFKKELYENGCIGSIAEIYDSIKPQLPKGAFAQCWSIGEIFRIILRK
ncbi:MAG: glycogen debranching protein [Clostridiales bacterium]|nr:glycogen debranching protein [Clostridiales bacterium]